MTSLSGFCLLKECSFNRLPTGMIFALWYSGGSRWNSGCQGFGGQDTDVFRGHWIYPLSYSNGYKMLCFCQNLCDVNGIVLSNKVDTNLNKLFSAIVLIIHQYK